MGLNKEAWGILDPDEQSALGLQFGMQKSSWQAGEIMDKSHYKYLEIKYRADKFIKMFTEHLTIFDVLIPDYIPGERTVIKYFTLCIMKRLKPMQAIAILNDNDLDKVYTKSIMNTKVVEQLRKWEKGEPFEVAMFNMVKEFDRWNNFRILPREIQEPSAFKRRIKNMYKKHIRVLSSIPDLSLKKLKQLSKTRKPPFAYLPLIVGNKIEIWKVKVNLNINKIYNEIALYIFADEGEAREYITQVFHYINKGKKDCKDGITFWEVYREQIKKAMNYKEIQNITPTRNHLELAFHRLEYF